MPVHATATEFALSPENDDTLSSPSPIAVRTFFMLSPVLSPIRPHLVIDSESLSMPAMAMSIDVAWSPANIDTLLSPSPIAVRTFFMLSPVPGPMVSYLDRLFDSLSRASTAVDKDAAPPNAPSVSAPRPSPSFTRISFSLSGAESSSASILTRMSES